MLNHTSHPKSSATERKTLFRPEVVPHQEPVRLGNVLITSPKSHSILAGISALFVLISLFFLATVSTSRKVTVRGFLQPTGGLTQIMPQFPGIISEVKVAEGQIVAANDILFVLKRSNARSRAQEENGNLTWQDHRSETIKLLHSQLVNYREEATRLVQQRHVYDQAASYRYRTLTEATKTVNQQIAMQEQRIALARSRLQQYIALKNANYISEIQLQDKQAEMFEHEHRLLELLRQKENLKSEMEQVNNSLKLQLLDNDREKKEIARKVSVIEAELGASEELKEIAIIAPREGVVSRISAFPGQNVGTSNVLASITPKDAKLEAEIYAPSEVIGFIHPGMQVSLHYVAYPYQKFGQHMAIVHEVANISSSRDELRELSIVNGDDLNAHYRVRLKLLEQTVSSNGSIYQLKPGMRVDVIAKLEERRLYEWLFGPIIFGAVWSK